MEKTTQLDKVKETAISFLHISVKETKFSPIVVQHPIFESALQLCKMYNGNETINILDCSEDERKKVYDLYTFRIKGCDSVSAVMRHIRKAYRLTFLKYTKKFLSDKDFSELLADVWTKSENPNDDVNVPISEIITWFKEADKKYLMTKKEWDYIEKLPEEITVYRGVSIDRNPDGLSYTDSLKKAIWFKERFERWNKKGYIITGKIKKEDILAYFDSRGEQEIVVKRSSLIDEKVIK